MASQPISNTSAGKFLALDGRFYSQVKTVSVKHRFSHTPLSPFLSQFLRHRFVQRRPCPQFYQLTPCVTLVRVEAERITWSVSVHQRFPNHNPLPRPSVAIALVHILRGNTGFSLVFVTRFEEKPSEKHWWITGLREEQGFLPVILTVSEPSTLKD